MRSREEKLLNSSSLDVVSKSWGNLPNRQVKGSSSIEEEKGKFRSSILWPDLIAQIFIHAGCVYGLYLCFVSAKIYTSLFALLLIKLSGFGITAGAHRLWSHRSYKAKWQLKLILIILFTITGQRHVFMWSWDHRIHHKFEETDSDPHNAKRGFLFSHIGWVVLTPHPKVLEKKRTVDMSDLDSDPFVVWHRRFYPIWFALLAVIFPVGFPTLLWDETLWNSFWINFNTRLSITLHMAFLVNSVAHMWGNKPYDKNISAVENLGVSLTALGEGWHNFHHVFPWDYKTGELGNAYNPTTTFINFFAKIGWAYDLKSAGPQIISRRAKKTGVVKY